MLPFVRDGEIVRVDPGAREPRLGDIIGFEVSPGRLVLHRVIRHRADGLVTKGDALRHRERVRRNEMLGTVVAVVRGRRLISLDTPHRRLLGAAVALVSPVLPAVLAVAFPLRRAWRAARGG